MSSRRYSAAELALLYRLALGRRWLLFRRLGGRVYEAVQWFPAEHQLRLGFDVDVRRGYSALPDPLTGVRFLTPGDTCADPVPVLNPPNMPLPRVEVRSGDWIVGGVLGRRLIPPEFFVEKYRPAWWPNRTRFTRDEYLAGCL